MFRFTWIGKGKQQKKKKKNKYKGPWQHPCSRHWHMIDYVIVHQRDLQDLHHVRTMRGAECWTDHCLLRAKMALKIHPKAQHTTTPHAKKLEISKFLPLPEIKNIFQNALTSIELDETNLWEDFKVKVLSAAQDILGFRKRKCQDWFVENYEEIDALLETKRNLFRKTLSTNLANQAKMEATKTYKDFQKVAQMHMRKIQNQWWLKKAEEAQLAANSKNSRLFYQIIKEFYQPQQSIFAPLKSKDGATLRRPEDIKK